MARKSMQQREIRRLKLVNQYKKQRIDLKKSIQQSKSFKEQLLIQAKLQKLPRDSVKSRLRNRCWLTGRSRGVYRDFGLSRHVLREMSHECLLPGVRKSSW